MANPLLSVTIDKAALIAALDRLPASMVTHTKSAAAVTAQAIKREAERRVRRRTGQTAEGIQVKEDVARVGYVVVSERNPYPNLPIWLEFGTEKMTPKPYFFVSAALEEGPHERRIAAAVQEAINETGLGS